MSKCHTIVDDVAAAAAAVGKVIPMSRFHNLSSQARQKQHIEPKTESFIMLSTK